MRPARSLLLVPGNRPAVLEDTQADAADAVIFDLASVPETEKPRARKHIRDRIAADPDRRWWVRVGPDAVSHQADDLAIAADVGHAEGVMLQGAASADAIRRVDETLAEAESSRQIEIGQIGLIVELDSAQAVFFAHAIAVASPRVVSLAFDGAEHGALATDLGCAWSIDGPGMMYARQYALVAARAADMSCPLDGYFANVDDPDGLRRDTETSRRLGYRGRVVIDPRQIDPVNCIYSPTPDEVAYHQRVLDTLEQAVADGRAAVALDGKMIDYAHAATARAVIAQARALGVIP
jgi:citrate lyase subunit beta/citryl-CoA lyase